MFQITIPLLYLLAAGAFGASRLPRFEARSRQFLLLAVALACGGVLLHSYALYGQLRQPEGLDISLGGAVSLIAVQLAVIALLGSLEASLRGMASGLLVLAGLAAITTGLPAATTESEALSWQLQAHVLISLFAYGLLTAGAIIAVFAMIQDRRLRAAKLSGSSRLFAPLETTEKMLFGVTAAGFAVLLLAVVSGFMFVDNLFAQHLVHKTAFSLLSLVLFGVLVGGRLFAGWRGRRVVYLYLWGFAFLLLAYFGSRYVLEVILDRSWG